MSNGHSQFDILIHLPRDTSRDDNNFDTVESLVKLISGVTVYLHVVVNFIVQRT